MSYFSQRGLCHDMSEGEWGSSLWRPSIGRGEGNPLLLIHTQRGNRAVQRSLGPRHYHPPPKPRAGFSVRHPSKDAGHAQPRNFAELLFNALGCIGTRIRAGRFFRPSHDLLDDLVTRRPPARGSAVAT